MPHAKYVEKIDEAHSLLRENPMLQEAMFRMTRQVIKKCGKFQVEATFEFEPASDVLCLEIRSHES